MSKITIFNQSCKGVEDCGICIFVCPQEIFAPSKEINDAGYLPPDKKDEDQCTDCQNCMIFCPDFAIVIKKDPLKASDEKGDEDE